MEKRPPRAPEPSADEPLPKRRASEPIEEEITACSPDPSPPASGTSSGAVLKRANSGSSAVIRLPRASYQLDVSLSPSPPSGASQCQVIPATPSSSTAALPGWLFFIATKNGNGHYFLASKENYFGGMKVDAVMIDSGCSSLLLPLKVGEIGTLYSLFPFSAYSWSVASSAVTQIEALILTIRAHIDPIAVRLCDDMSLPCIKATPGCTVELSFIRFHLCSEDAAFLMSGPQATEIRGIENVPQFLASHPRIRRRSYALLGQVILEQFSVLQHQSAMFGLEHSFTADPLGWSIIGDLCNHLCELDQSSLPDGFDTLEDEDHGGDDEDYRCSPLAASTLSDEIQMTP